MYETLFLGKELVQLEIVDSTNLYLKKILEETNKKVEGMLVITQHQTLGRGQMGKVWESEKGMNK